MLLDGEEFDRTLFVDSPFVSFETGRRLGLYVSFLDEILRETSHLIHGRNGMGRTWLMRHVTERDHELPGIVSDGEAQWRIAELLDTEHVAVTIDITNSIITSVCANSTIAAIARHFWRKLLCCIKTRNHDWLTHLIEYVDKNVYRRRLTGLLLIRADENPGFGIVNEVESGWTIPLRKKANSPLSSWSV